MWKYYPPAINDFLSRLFEGKELSEDFLVDTGFRKLFLTPEGKVIGERIKDSLLDEGC